MNKVIIIVLLFTFVLKAKGTSSTIPNDTDLSNSTVLQGSATQSEKITNNVTSPSSTLRKSHSTSKSGNSSGYGNSMKTTTKNPKNKDSLLDNLDLKMILTFLLGVCFSTIIFSTVLCCAMICNRCRTKHANKDEESIILESVKHECEQSDGQQAPLQAQSTITSAEYSGTEEELKILEKEQTERAEEVSEVDYASINYSLLQKKDGDLKPQKTESDYAEIQIKKLSEEVEMLQDGEKQDEVTQHEVKQDGVDQGLEGGIESQKQVELDEVQV